ncbi:G-protein alpha subunit-domain-containing protein [Xylaria sp. FL1042]|nr:G-protein alpha subunit-domain-containing protein [Xylaria sp. FL1042]
MDPVTIVQIVGTAVSLGDVVIKCIVGLRSFKNRYHDAPLVVSTIIGQLYMVQSALDQLAIWNKPEHARDPRFRQLAWQIDNALDCFSLLVTTLERRLKDVESMTTTQRLTFLWGEKETSDFSILLDRQVNALNLLLQAVQCNTLAQQQDLLLRKESQSILQQAKDCSSSIIGLEDSASFISENTAGISLMFDFDDVILASKIYQQAGRSHLRQAIRAQNHAPAPEQLEDRSQKTDSVNQPSSSSLQLQSTSKPSNQARILRLVNPWRKAPKPEITTPITTPDNSPKLLILGTSESGKTTVLQGMKLVFEGTYTQEEKLAFRDIIWSNIVMSTRVVLEAMESLLIPLNDERMEYHVQTIFMQPTLTETPNREAVTAISALWRDEGFQEAYGRRNEYQLNDSAAYYAQEIQRLTAPDYVPTDEDILRARWKTTGITETCFSDPTLLQGHECKLLDVGGLRSERKKWIHAFPGASVVLFTVDTTAYARLLFENEAVNRMEEQLVLVDSVINSRWFSKSVFVFIFTKLDLIEEWLQNERVEKYFPDYPYRTLTVGFVERYMQYLTNRFLSLVESEQLGRVRIVQGDLIHGYKDTVTKIVEAVNDLTARYA